MSTTRCYYRSGFLSVKYWNNNNNKNNNMAYGLQTFNSDGSLKLDISSRLIRTVAIHNISSPPYTTGILYPYPANSASNFVVTGYYIDNQGKKGPLYISQLSNGFYVYAFVNYSYNAVVNVTGY